jgi:hypothetical protein
MIPTVPIHGDRESIDKYVGALGEIAVDDSNQEIRVFNGADAGGKRVPNKDTNDARYQKRSEELDGFNFKAGLRGFVTRTAPGIYTIRSLKMGDGIELVDGDGFGGDPTIRLDDIIPGDRQFTGSVQVLGVFQAEGGINADIEGTHYGESKGTHTGPQVGSVDVRGKSLQLDDGQIPAAKIGGLAAAPAPIPIGGIIMWVDDEIPAGWALCDGNNGTPNLVNRFVRGGTLAQVGTIDGAVSHTHVSTIADSGSHTHTGTVAGTALTTAHLPSHQHGAGVTDEASANQFNHGTKAANPPTTGSVDTGSSAGTREALTDFVGGDQPHAHGLTINAAGVHTHSTTVEPALNIPPYFAVAFIMRIA